MNEDEYFKKLINTAIENKSEIAPESPQEFDIYCDNFYNLYMFIKGTWINIGINTTFI